MKRSVEQSTLGDVLEVDDTGLSKSLSTYALGSMVAIEVRSLHCERVRRSVPRLRVAVLWIDRDFGAGHCTKDTVISLPASEKEIEIELADQAEQGRCNSMVVRSGHTHSHYTVQIYLNQEQTAHVLTYSVTTVRGARGGTVRTGTGP